MRVIGSARLSEQQLRRRRCVPRQLRPRRRCTSRSPSTTGRPSTSSSSSGGGDAEGQGGDRVGDAGVRQRVDPPQRQVGELARLERADLVGPTEHRGAAHRRQLAAPPAPTAPSGRRAPGRTAPRAAAPRSATPASLRRRTVDPEADRHAGVDAGRGSGAMPAPSRALLDGQCATPVPVAANRATAASSRCTACAIQTSSPSQPSESTYSVGVAPNRSRQNVLLVVGLGEVGVQPDAVPPGQVGRLGHQLRRSPRTASTARPRSAASRRTTGRGSASIAASVAARIASRSSTTSSGGRPPCARAEVHRAAASGGTADPPPRPPRSPPRAGRRRRAGRRSGGRCVVVQPVRASQAERGAGAARTTSSSMPAHTG